MYLTFGKYTCLMSATVAGSVGCVQASKGLEKKGSTSTNVKSSISCVQASKGLGEERFHKYKCDKIPLAVYRLARA